jgi:uncharacterized protein (DUF302 family)
MAETGIAEVASPYPVAETADRLQALLQKKGMKIFARIDQAAEAAAGGLSLPPMILLVFGDPKSGTPLMNRYPSLAIDLPLKALVRETADGKVTISYNSPEYLQRRHGLEAPPFAPLAALFKAAVE